MRGNVTDTYQLDAFVQHLTQSCNRSLSVLVIRNYFDDRSGALCHLQVSDVVTDVLGARGQNPIAGFERNRVKRHVKRASSVFDDGDFPGRTIDQLCSSIVNMFERGKLA